MNLSELSATAVWSGGITLVGLVVAWLTTRLRNKADITSVLSETSLEWIHELRAEIDRLQSEVVALQSEIVARREVCELHAAGLEAEIAALEARGNRLTSWLREQGMDFPGAHEREG